MNVDELLGGAYAMGRQTLRNFSILTDRNYRPAWLHDEIAEKLEAVERGEIKRLIIEVPPRHGKTQLATINFPAWYLGRHPDKEIIVSAYSEGLAQDFGAKTRDIVSSPEYQSIFPGVGLKSDTQSKVKWATDDGGSYTSVGIGGSLTGRGCIAENELVQTLRGLVPIQEVQVNDFVLSFNHDLQLCEWKRVLAKVDKGIKKTVRIANRLTCTPCHRIFDGDLYKRADESKYVCEVIYDNVPELLRNVPGTIDRMETQKAEEVLRCRLFEFSNVKEVFSSLSCLWEKGFSWVNQVLFKCLRWAGSAKGEADKVLRPVQKQIQGKVLEKPILFQRLQKRFSFNKNARGWQSSFYSWVGMGAVHARFSEGYFSACSCQRRDGMCAVYEDNASNRSSHRQKQEKQQSYESCDVVQFVPRDSAQIKRVPRGEAVEDRIQRVWDIQVEDNHNFFVNGLLVHNCDLLIIDDPLKNREEAESDVIRKKIWDWYTSTARTRLEKDAAVIIIMTRWHMFDLVGLLIEAEGGGGEKWHRVTFPAISTRVEANRGIGEALWPEKYNVQALEDIHAAIGERDWLALFQQTPTASDSQDFRLEFFRYFEEEDIQGKRLDYYTGVDLAISQKDSADNVVIRTIGKERDKPRIYLIEETVGKLDPLATIQALFMHYERYQPIKVGIETVAYQQALIYFLQEEMRRRQVYFNIQEIKSTTQKETRIRSLVPMYRAGVIMHRRSDKPLEAELLQFPQGKHDDRIDALQFAVQMTVPTEYHSKIRKSMDFDSDSFVTY